MSDWPILSLVTFVPLLGAVFIFCMRGKPDEVARNARHHLRVAADDQDEARPYQRQEGRERKKARRVNFSSYDDG